MQHRAGYQHHWDRFILIHINDKTRWHTRAVPVLMGSRLLGWGHKLMR